MQTNLFKTIEKFAVTLTGVTPIYYIRTHYISRDRVCDISMIKYVHSITFTLDTVDKDLYNEVLTFIPNKDAFEVNRMEYTNYSSLSYFSIGNMEIILKIVNILHMRFNLSLIDDILADVREYVADATIPCLAAPNKSTQEVIDWLKWRAFSRPQIYKEFFMSLMHTDLDLEEILKIVDFDREYCAFIVATDCIVRGDPVSALRSIAGCTDPDSNSLRARICEQIHDLEPFTLEPGTAEEIILNMDFLKK